MSPLVKEAEVLYDRKGKKTHVILSYKSFEQLVERLEDAEDLKAMKEVEHQKNIPCEKMEMNVD